MQGKDYSLPMWVETDISLFVTGRLHYCNPARLPPPPGFHPVGFAVRSDDLSKGISVTLGKFTAQHTFDAWIARLNAHNRHWSNDIDERPSHPTDGELTVEFTGMSVSEGVRAFAMQYLQEFHIEEKLTHGNPTAVITKY